MADIPLNPKLERLTKFTNLDELKDRCASCFESLREQPHNSERKELLQSALYFYVIKSAEKSPQLWPQFDIHRDLLENMLWGLIGKPEQGRIATVVKAAIEGHRPVSSGYFSSMMYNLRKNYLRDISRKGRNKKESLESPICDNAALTHEMTLSAPLPDEGNKVKVEAEAAILTHLEGSSGNNSILKLLLAGKNYAEIAAEKSITIPAAKSRIFREKIGLREKISAKYPELFLKHKQADARSL